MSRLDAIKTSYITALQSYSVQHPEYGSVESIWNTIHQADPDKNRHIHTRWLASRTLDETILWEDIAAGSNSKAYDILKRFLSVRAHLLSEHRDLYKHSDLPSVTAAIRPYEDIITLGEVEHALRKRVDRDTVVLYEAHGYKIVVPMSEEASCYWGRGTEWCTAATKSDNMFMDYHKYGPLVICILPNGKKVQFHENSPPMDENDSELKDITDPFLTTLSLYFCFLKSVHVSRITYEDCVKTVECETHDFTCIESIPQNLWDTRLALTVCKKIGMSLGYIPETLRDYDVCLAAVKSNGWALLDIPGHIIDKNICMEAMKQTGNALGHVPEKFRDREMCLQAVTNNGPSLCYVPDILRDREICLTAVKQDGVALEYVPKKIRDKEMCLTAVKNSSYALSSVPYKICDYDIYREAVLNKGSSIKSVPKELWTEELITLSLHYYRSSRFKDDAINIILDSPKELRTHAVYMEAVRTLPSALKIVPEDMRCYDLYREAVNNNGCSLQYIPKNEQTLELCLAAVKNNGWALQYVTKKFRTPEVLLNAVTHCGDALRHMQKKQRIYALCFNAVKSDGNVLLSVPENLRDYDLCYAAVDNYGPALGNVPNELRDIKICLAAVKKNKHCLKHVPNHLHPAIENAIEDNIKKSPQPDWIKTRQLDDIKERLLSSASI